jgi:hypothetical protein
MSITRHRMLYSGLDGSKVYKKRRVSPNMSTFEQYVLRLLVLHT